MSLFKMWCGLRAAGWVRTEHVDAISDGVGSQSITFVDDVLDRLVSAWNRALDTDLTRRERVRGERIRQWIEQQRGASSCLTFGAPGRMQLGQFGVGGDLQSRFVFWTHGIPAGPSAAIVSSRFGRKLDHHKEWLAAFRTACHLAKSQDAVILTVPRTVTDRFIGPAAEMFGLRTLTIHEPRSGETLPRWFERLASANFLSRLEKTPHAIVSPQVTRTENEIAEQQQPAAEPDSIPWRDRVLASLVTRLFILHVRRGGNVQKLARSWLQDQELDASNVILARGPTLIPADMTAEFLALGAGSFVPPSPGNIAGTNTTSGSPFQSAERIHGNGSSTSQVLYSPPTGEWQYLTHCTRAHDGPWPDQTESDYVKEVLNSPEPPERTTLSSLQRILTTRKIVATGRTLRGRVRAVCLSAVSPAELSRLHVFRPHRGHWDFEPYGICIRREWLMQRGARPVLYGDEVDWEKLTIADRPYFQRRFTRGRRTGRITDWSVEREWRHLGDVDLTPLPADMALLLVATRDDAEALVRVSPWPILVLGMTR